MISTTHEENGVVFEQVLLATTLHEDLDDALDELKDSCERLLEAETLIKESQKNINGMSRSFESGTYLFTHLPARGCDTVTLQTSTPRRTPTSLSMDLLPDPVFRSPQ